MKISSTSKFYLGLCISSLILFFLLIPIGGFPGHHIKFLAALVLYAGLTYFYLKRATSARQYWMVVAILAFPPIIVYGTVFALHSNRAMFSAPSSIAHLIGILCGLIFFNLRKLSAIVFLVFFAVFSLLATFKGYSLWIHYVNYGSPTGIVADKSTTILLKDKDGNVHHVSNPHSSYVVLDFWHTACGVCFKKFPKLEESYQKYQKDSKVKVYAVNKPILRDTVNQAFDVINHLQYSFPVLIAPDSLVDQLGITYYPTTIVLNAKGDIIYRGEIEGIGKVIK